MALIVEQALLPNISTSVPTTVPLTKFTGEVPKALIFMMGFPVGNENGISLGFCTDPVSTPNWCAAVGNRDGQGSTRTARQQSSQRIGGLVSNASGNWARSAQVTSIGVNEFEMQGYGVSISGHPFLALGGSDLLNAKVVRWESDLATPGIKSVTGAGFRPNFGVSVCNELTPESENSGVTALSHNVFYWGPNTSVAASIGARSNQGTSGEFTSYMENTGVHIMTAASSIREVADPAVFTADGADLNYTVVRAGTNFLVYTLFLEFANDNVIVGSVQAPTTPGMVTDPLGFTGKGVLSLCCSQTGTNVQAQQHSRMMYGMMDDDDVQGGVALLGQDGVGTSNSEASNDIYLSHGFNNVSDWNDDTDVAFGTFTGTDINFDWIGVNGTNRFRTSYIAFGEGGVPPATELSGTITAEFDTQNDLDVTPPAQLAGTVDAEFDTLGDLDVSPVLAGLAAAEFDTQGALDVSPVLAGLVAAEFDTAGDFDIGVFVELAGQIDAFWQTLGNLDVVTAGQLAGTLAAVFDTQGNLDVAAATQLAGLAGASFDTLGDLDAKQVVGGLAAGEFDTLGALDVSAQLAGQIDAFWQTFGNFDVVVPGQLGGSIAARFDTQGDFDVTTATQLAGVAPGYFNTLGSLSIQAILAGLAAAEFDTRGNIPVGVFSPMPGRICVPPDEHRSCTPGSENRNVIAPGESRSCISREV